MRDGRLPRYLRRNQTDAERLLWGRLRRRALGVYFRRQHEIVPYVVDFACLEARLIVEVDGGQHAESDRDASRDAALVAAGFTALRFWNNEVLRNLDGVCLSILEALPNRPPPP